VRFVDIVKQKDLADSKLYDLLQLAKEAGFTRANQKRAQASSGK
jgi:hypothetical protein